MSNNASYHAASTLYFFIIFFVFPEILVKVIIGSTTSFGLSTVMGFLNYISDLCDCDWSRYTSSRKLKKRKQLQTVEIRVKMDCEGCARRVKKSVEGMRGLTAVEVEPKQHKLSVTGYVDPAKVLQRVRHRTGKKAELWPYVPYDVVGHPYAPGAYDKKAPPGYVRNVVSDPEASSLARASSFEIIRRSQTKKFRPIN
ncbi:heavy metal-associated isoprenylated plant protein 26 isoform X2 [Carica papaya]|uniref:heavy metal-associated isoprenylated plant protein 26 isoform X2 n=1 Tax=Carica papaya TaxID=3649 RepID=UPI000B8CFD63|nr:heavy metal-associated isoprenylated plant protein 26 isoform X2 [Carica papaya]